MPVVTCKSPSFNMFRCVPKIPNLVYRCVNCCSYSDCFLCCFHFMFCCDVDFISQRYIAGFETGKGKRDYCRVYCAIIIQQPCNAQPPGKDHNNGGAGFSMVDMQPIA